MDTKFEDIVSEIRQTVDKYPGHVAVTMRMPVVTMTYQEWWQQALCFAEGLRRQCHGSEYVIIELPKSAHYLVSLLGCWMAGKAFIPLGPDLPESRKADIKSQVKNYAHITPDTYQSFLSRQPICQTATLKADTPAYMIFSSGTTGTPKGIIVGHSGLVNLARCQREAFGLNSQSRSLFFLSVNFDASISDILTTLTSGATLVIEPDDSLSLSVDLMGVIGERRITHADLPPSLLRVINPATCPESLQTVIIGGEPADKNTVRNWADKVRLINVYGPTEATVCTSLCQYTENWSMPVVGREIKGAEYHIYDKGNLDATEGELWITGSCLSIGYFNNPELTEEKFPVVDGIRYYRTSDHVRRLQNGDIAFLGRFDRQVKIHGQLVELEEVEQHLKQLRLVKNAAVVKRNLPGRDEKGVLVAFVETDESAPESNDRLPGQPAGRQGQQAGWRRIIVSGLRHHLPAWMMPAHIEFVDSLPRVATGKVDFKALERMPIAVWPTGWAEEPYTSDEERTIALLMADILKLPRVNPHDDFLQLGADSLDTLLLIARLQGEHGITITPDQMKRDASPATLSRIDGIGVAMATSGKDLKSEWKQPVTSSPSGVTPVDDLILITGATGFLGSHILEQVLCRPEYSGRQIVCLVRCTSAEHGEQRLRTVMRQYGLHSNQWHRTTIVPCDLARERMGLPDGIYKYLADNVSEVYHLAATVNMMADYASLRESNVTATRHVAEFCLTGCRKQLHYASTLSVFVSTSRNEGVVYEHDRLDEDCTVYGGYAQTKFVCERILLGIPPSLCTINVIRFGLLCGDTSSALSASKDFLGMFMRGASAVGVLPWDNTGQMGIDITPIDIATNITIDIATRSRNGIYHVAAENPLQYNQLCKLMSETLGIRIVDDFAEWQEMLQPYRQNSDVAALEMSLCRMDARRYERWRYMDLFQTTNIKFDMTNTHRATPLRIYQDEQLIVKYINHEKMK